MIQRPMSEVRESELLSPATYFFLNRCVIALDFPSGFSGSSDGKNLPIMQETWVPSLGREDPLEKEIATRVFLPGESHGQRSLAGYSPWGCKRVGHFTLDNIHVSMLFS